MGTVPPVPEGNSCDGKTSYYRGVGIPLSECEGMEKDGALCYPYCRSGYVGVGPICWQKCPSGFVDIGVSCLKPASYGRGAGYALWDKSKCESRHK